MNRNRHLALLTLSAAVAALSACGGGGGDSATPAPSPGPAPAPAPSPSGTGLTPPTGSLTMSASTASSLVSKATDAFGKAAGGFAAQTLGGFAPGLADNTTGPFNCPGGGTVTFAPSGSGSGVYTYNACMIDGVSYSGSGNVTFSLSGSALQSYTINEAAITAAVAGTTVALDEQVSCSLSGTDMICVGRYGDNSWGNDFSYGGGTANGSYQCECSTNQWNSTFSNFTATSGSVDTAANVGTANIVRNSGTAFTVTITVNGSSSTFNVGQ